MVSSNRLRRIAGLDILPMKPHQGWSSLQLDEALRKPELFRGNRQLYAAVRQEAIRRGLGSEEDYAVCPFPKMDIASDQREAAELGLPFLLDEDKRRAKRERKERKKRLKKLLETVTMPEREKKSALNRLLRLAAAIGDAGTDTTALDRQLELYLRRSIERQAHMVPSKETETPPMWRRNMDYAPEEGSPYFGSVAEFMKRFPGGIPEWRKWREKTREKRERRWRIASLMPGKDEEFETFLREAWRQETLRPALAHFVPEGGDDVAKLGDEEPKLWSDEPKWKSIDEFLEAHRTHYGQNADDAALKAARDFIKYWKLTARKPKDAGRE